MANLGKGLGAALESFGAGMIKQGETIGNMMYLTAAADKEAARKAGAAGLKAQHDTMLKYLDRMGADVDELSKQYVAAITAQDPNADVIGEQLTIARGNLEAAWDSVLGRKPRKKTDPTYTEEVSAYLKSYGVGDKLRLLHQDLLGDKSSAVYQGSLKRIRDDYKKLHPNWDKLDEKTRTGIIDATVTQIISIKPEDIVIDSQVTPKVSQQEIVGDIKESQAAAAQRGNWAMGAFQDYVKRAPQNVPGATFNAAENARLLQQQMPSDTPANLEMGTSQSSTSQQAFKQMMGSASGMGGMAADFEENPAASAEARALAAQQAQAQSAGQQASPQATPEQALTQATPDDVAAIRRFMKQLLQLIESMGQVEAMQAMSQRFRGLSPSQKQILLADKQYGAAFKQLMR